MKICMFETTCMVEATKKARKLRYLTVFGIFVESLLLFFEVLAGQLEGVWNLLEHGNMRLTEHGS